MEATMMRQPLPPCRTYQPIEDYAVIGDLYTVALVGKNGSIDWCCLPHFDSPSVFGALLDAHKGGFFRIAPPDTSGMGCRQLYVPETNILITRFLSSDGIGEITDFMPIKHVGRILLAGSNSISWLHQQKEGPEKVLVDATTKVEEVANYHFSGETIPLDPSTVI